MTVTQLTPAQHAILTYAHQHTEGKIAWFPENIKGGARQKVIDGLFKRALITYDGIDWFVAAEGYDALGLPRTGPVTLDDPEIEAAVGAIEAAAKANVRKPRTRDHSKQAQVIAMLKRPEGATITQICERTQWERHTVRGTFAGAFKKKLGLVITSTKSLDGDRVYRIVG